VLNYQVDPMEIRRALELCLQPGQVTELRVVHAWVEGERRPGTYSGYFDREHISALIAACQRIRSATACYFIPNAIRPELLGRAYNRARIVRDREPLTTDKDIVERRWLLIDVDAVRPTGVSATAAEKAAAEGLVTAIDYELWERGLPPGIIGDSGNGAHLMIPMRMPAEDGGFCQKMLKGLAHRFNTPQAAVDVTVHNAARLWKLPGTLVCKGDHCPEIGREWRMASILQAYGEEAYADCH
jgi:hypothetical protein